MMTYEDAVQQQNRFLGDYIRAVSPSPVSGVVIYDVANDETRKATQADIDAMVDQMRVQNAFNRGVEFLIEARRRVACKRMTADQFYALVALIDKWPSGAPTDG